MSESLIVSVLCFWFDVSSNGRTYPFPGRIWVRVPSHQHADRSRIVASTVHVTGKPGLSATFLGHPTGEIALFDDLVGLIYRDIWLQY